MPGTELSLVRVALKTGRHHQIRVQMAHHGTPLYGDMKYGVPVGTAKLDKKENADQGTMKQQEIEICRVSEQQEIWEVEESRSHSAHHR